jgi:hypothetical protein
VSSSIAVLVLLLFVAWSAHLLIALEATSTVTAVSTDAARQVAARDVAHDDPAAVRRAEVLAERSARTRLGALSSKVTYRWTVTPTEVQLDVALDQPWRLGPGWSPTRAFSHVHRTIVTHIERAR